MRKLSHCSAQKRPSRKASARLTARCCITGANTNSPLSILCYSQTTADGRFAQNPIELHCAFEGAETTREGTIDNG
jgi:hypothetical protein